MERTDGERRERMVLLWIEHDEADVGLFREGLAEVGIDVDLRVVPNAVQGFSFLSRRPPFAAVPRPDLVVVDLNLPLISGQRFLEELRLKPRWRSLPVVLLTSSAKPADRERAVASGARFYTKPMTWDGIVALCGELRRAMEEGLPCACRPG